MLTTPPTRRRWLQFSLWTFYVALTLAMLAVPVGAKLYRDWYERRAQQQKIASDVAQLIPMLGKMTMGSIGSGDVRAIHAARRLGEIGPPARDALPALEKMASSNNPRWRSEATAAVAKITGRLQLSTPPHSP